MGESVRFGKYVLLSKLGEGGMGRVDRAVLAGPMGFHKEVAIKRIRTDSASKRAGTSLINEARLGGQLKHPNIVEVYELGEMDQGMFISMEFVNGVTLDAVLAACFVREMLLPLPVVFDIMEQICAALDYAHTARDTSGKPLEVVHRDLKPGNVILSRDGTTKVMDFGIAKTTAALYVTATTGVAKGTPLYMSPEQIEGSKDLDHRSDVFALGAILYELATGCRLFEAAGVANMFWRVLSCQVDDQIEELDALLPGLGEAARGCLQKEPDDRYSAAGELGAALRALRRPDQAGAPGAGEFVAALIGASDGLDPTAEEDTTEELLVRFESLAEESRWPSVAKGLRLQLGPREDPLLEGLQPIYNDSDLETLVRGAATAPTEGADDRTAPRTSSRRLWLAAVALLLIGLAGALLFGPDKEPVGSPVVEAGVPESSVPPPPGEGGESSAGVPAPGEESEPGPDPEPEQVPTTEPTPEPTPAPVATPGGLRSRLRSRPPRRCRRRVASSR